MTSTSLRLVAGSVAVTALAVTALTLSGCGAHVAQLKEAASADLGCPKSRVQVLNSGRTRDVEACGQRATYHWEDGDWRMIARSGGPGVPVAGPQPVMRSAPPPGVAPAQPAPVSGGAQLPPSQPTGTPSQPPPTPSAPPAAPAPVGAKSL
jgi:hypothetical protein